MNESDPRSDVHYLGSIYLSLSTVQIYDFHKFLTGYSISYEPCFLSLHCKLWNLVFPAQIHSLCASHLGHKSKQKKFGV